VVAGRGRSRADDLLVATLAGGATVEAAAALCEVSERTIYRRLKDPAFKARVAQARADLVERSLGHLSLGAVDAAVTLRNLLEAEDNRVKLGAARAILELGLKVRDSVEIEARLRTLEEQQALQERRAGT
jgi:hypothetical protein